jgi:hypothetical protein
MIPVRIGAQLYYANVKIAGVSEVNQLISVMKSSLRRHSFVCEATYCENIIQTIRVVEDHVESP